MPKVLMISLDKKILDSKSATARRMIEYGKENELFILLPARAAQQLNLSPTVHIQATGGNRLLQYQRLKTTGYKIIIREKATLVTTQDPFFTGRVGVWLKKKTGIKLEVQIHGDFYGSNYYRKSGWKNWLRYQLGQRVIWQADQLRVVGERIKKSVIDLGLVEEEKIIVKPVPINYSAPYKEAKAKSRLAYINPLHQDYQGYDKFFLWGGRIERVKNLDFLIDIFYEIANENHSHLLLIIGDGTDESRLQSKVKKLKLKNVRFIRWLNNLTVYLEHADCVLFPSLSEGYGLVAMEAAAAGTPVIMNDVGVANYELKPSAKVKIISVTDKQAWLKAIKSV